MSRVAVIGAGAWGTTLALLLAENKHQVTLWAFEKELVAEIKEFRENKKFLPGFPLPETIDVTADFADLKGQDAYYFVVPTQHLRSVARQAAKAIGGSAVLVAAGKGIEDKSLKLPLAIIAEETKQENLCVLSGPNLSTEIAKGLPAAAVAASGNDAVAKKVQSMLMSPRFRVYTNNDVIGVQLGGALKNVVAIAAGVVDGLGLGDNAKAGLMIRGLAEIARLGAALGAKQETFAGLSGMGDLITTCSSRLSRNHTVGEQIACGKKLPEILKTMKDIAEGVPTSVAARELGKRHQVPLPITEQVYGILYENKDPYQAISALMTRAAVSE